MNKIDRIWTISLLVISISALIINLNNLFELNIPVLIIRILAIFDLVGLFVFGYATVKKYKKNKE